MRVLVTDGENRAALAIVRSLGRAGHWVAVAGRSTGALAQASGYCRHVVQYPDPVRDEAGFLSAIREAVATLQVELLIPVTDITTILTTTNMASFPGVKIPFAEPCSIARAADKVDVLTTAMRLGVPVPRTLIAHDAHFDVSRLDLPYPVVVKPARSRVRTPAGWISSTVTYASNEAELRDRLAAFDAGQFPIALQEKISGHGLGVFLCYVNGKPVASFAHRRLREKPPSGGVSVLSESIAVPAAARGYARALLDELQWNGVAMVEFKQDDRDGVPKLMEINGRFWGSLQLAIDAGVDFPRILVEAASGMVPAREPEYRVGVMSRWLWGDVDSLLIQLFGAGSTARSLKGGRLGVVRSFLRLWDRDLYYENPRWSDLRPWFSETRQWFLGSR